MTRGEHYSGENTMDLTQEIKDSLLAAKLAFLATASGNGTPNVVPVASFRLRDDGTLLVSDQYFNKTLSNMQENPVIAFTWWGEKGGFQIKGTVTIHTDDDIFRENIAWMKERWPKFSPKSAALVRITDVFIVKPDPEPGKKIL